MLTALELENFKGVAARQHIDFAPLTLLFGANSAGKSTIRQALLYLHELLESGDADVDCTELGAMSLSSADSLDWCIATRSTEYLGVVKRSEPVTRNRSGCAKRTAKTCMPSADQGRSKNTTCHLDCPKTSATGLE
jgi:hypothetical protein